MRTIPFTTPDRPVIPCYCWIRKPDTEIRCTEQPHAEGDHYNAYHREEWAHGGPEPQ